MIIESRSLPSPPTASTRQDYPVMVLLVDDQLMIGEALRRTLAGHPDIAFHYCPDPNRALAVARDVRPTVILQDLVMPGVNGLDLVRRYREDPVVRDVPVIVLSSREEPLTRSEAFGAGANDYLVKLHPLSFPRLPEPVAARRGLCRPAREPVEADRGQPRTPEAHED